MSPESQIIKNLKSRVVGVTSMCAIAGVDDVLDGHRRLRDLVSAGIVIQEVKQSGPYTMTLYRYNAYRLLRKPNLKLVTADE